MTPQRLATVLVLLVCLALMMPLSAMAEEEYPQADIDKTVVDKSRSDEEFHATLSYGNVSLHDFYGEQWDGESIGISFSGFFKKYFGVSLGYHGVEARTDERELEGRYTSNGLDIFFYLSPKVKWLRVVALDFKAFGKPSKLVLGGYARYFHSKEYFYDNDFNADQADFPGNEYGAHLGLTFEM